MTDALEMTAYDIATDPRFLGLVCEALADVASSLLLDAPVVDWTTATMGQRFAASALLNTESYRHMAALAALSSTEAPSDPYDGVWLRNVLHERWPALSIAGLYGSRPL